MSNLGFKWIQTDQGIFIFHLPLDECCYFTKLLLLISNLWDILSFYQNSKSDIIGKIYDFYCPIPGCSKLTTSLVIVSLAYPTLASTDR